MFIPMLIIKLNNLNYRYDVFHIFKLFYDFKDIEFKEENYDYEVIIEESQVRISHKDNLNCVYKLSGKLKFKEEIKRCIFNYLRHKTDKELPWGILIGIRPTKKVHEMLNEGFHEGKIIEFLMNNYYLREDKARLCIQVAKVERELVNKESKTISVYIGMPFCPTRCFYCSFASNPINTCRKLVEPYLKALEYEIKRIKEFIDIKGLNIECVYFGGGTPTAIGDQEFDNILSQIYNSFVKGRKVKEFNVECGRPDSITENKLKSMKRCNVNRISINPQSMNEDTLKSIGRNHSIKDIVEKFNLARELGFENINMDLIIGLPNEKLEHVENTCKEILKLNPDSITVHGMSIKRASILHEQMISGKIKIIEQSQVNDMYHKTTELAKELDMEPYYMYRQKNMVGNMENIGYCKRGKEGLYNIQMIEEKQTIIALGADAVTKVIFLDTDRIERVGNLKDVKEYISRIQEKTQQKVDLLETLY